MIKKVHIKFFKIFSDQTFDFDDSIVLAGPNNSGKSTLLQAIATWHLAFSKWKEKQQETGRKRKNRVALTRKEFMSLPVRHFNLLWHNTSTALQKSEGGGQGAATPRVMEITLEGDVKDSNESWTHTMEFLYANPEVIYVKEVFSGEIRPAEIDEMKVVYIPSFSGIGTEEAVQTEEYQQWLIGQGKPGDIIRNLLKKVSEDETAWEKICQDIKSIFRYELLKPVHAGQPFILCEYRPTTLSGHRASKLDIASAGSGFLQTLLLLSFFYARESTILLIDEPDAHLHSVLQKQVYEHLRQVALGRRCQLVIATHSEVIINNAPFDNIMSFYKKPCRLTHKAEKKQIIEALRFLDATSILQAQYKRILYLESDSDFNILKAWGEALNHRLTKWFSSPELFYFPLKGNDVRYAKRHFFGLRGFIPDMQGVLLLDRDNRDLPDHEVTAKKLKIIRWNRYEIENYLVHPESIERFIKALQDSLFQQTAGDKAKEIMHDHLPPAVVKSPLEDNDYLNKTAASKNILPQILNEFINKSDYHRLAAAMLPNEIHPEVTEKLNAIADHLGITDN